MLLIKETSWLKQIAELENNYPEILLSNIIAQIYTVKVLRTFDKKVIILENYFDVEP